MSATEEKVLCGDLNSLNVRIEFFLSIYMVTGWVLVVFTTSSRLKVGMIVVKHFAYIFFPEPGQS